QRINVTVNVGGISSESSGQSGQSKTGIKSVILQNDQGMLDPSKAFFPFGNNPGIRSNFYVGSAEIFSKELAALNLRVQWKDVPAASLEDYYRNLAFYRVTDDTISQFYQLVQNPPNQSVQNILTEESPETGQPRADEIGKTLNNSKNEFLSQIELENRIPAEVLGELSQWMDSLKNNVFQAGCYLREDAVWKKLTDKALFDEPDATQPNVLAFRDEENLKQFIARPIEEELTDTELSPPGPGIAGLRIRSCEISGSICEGRHGACPGEPKY
ncbi:MAG TPA: hypothetical protein VKA68_12670, partial [bacterium]|nr:hypothetical protein [bacterium]